VKRLQCALSTRGRGLLPSVAPPVKQTDRYRSRGVRVGQQKPSFRHRTLALGCARIRMESVSDALTCDSAIRNRTE
jgi:hypothetical protein